MIKASVPGSVSSELAILLKTILRKVVDATAGPLIVDYVNSRVILNTPIRLKTYTTAERNALTPATGDMIYNSTEGGVEA